MFLNRIGFFFCFIFAPSKLFINQSVQSGVKIYIMNNLRNRVQLIGHLGNKPEIKTLDSGKKMAKFSIATNETYKNNKGEKVTDTEWHNVVAWNKTAEIAEMYLDKGKEIALEGKLSTRAYEDQQGVKRYVTEIVCQELLLLGSK
jgi:single-strand DNA-binding protein